MKILKNVFFEGDSKSQLVAFTVIRFCTCATVLWPKIKYDFVDYEASRSAEAQSVTVKSIHTCCGFDPY